MGALYDKVNESVKVLWVKKQIFSFHITLHYSQYVLHGILFMGANFPRHVVGEIDPAVRVLL